MKLKRLYIQGFKSFKDRTTINFDNGITGIVGPNGCGKSNIVDAIFWVMGEQSAKHLRGNSMKDVIFSGSSKYNPGTWAKVSLVLVNDTAKHIHIGSKVLSPSEIEITRKLYRNGETQYLINGMPCRLKDIQEVFMDTGAGAKSYSIIAQGEIERLVQAKPIERRMIIEDVAGITKFKMRKKDSLRKIEQTQSNLNRLNDLKVEVDKNLNSLKLQAQKAERAKSLQDKIQKHELIVDSHKEFNLLKKYSDDKQSLNELNLDCENWQVQKNTLEIDLEQERLERDEQGAKIEEYQNIYNEASKELVAKETQLDFTQKAKTEKEGMIATRKKESTVLQEELADRQSRLEQLEVEQQELTTQKVVEQDFSDLEERVGHLNDEFDSKVEGLKELKEDTEDLRRKKLEIEQEVFKNTTKQEELSFNLQDISEEVHLLETKYTGVTEEIVGEKEEVYNREKAIEVLAQKESNLKEQISVQTQSYTQKEKILRVKTKEMIQMESKLSSLKELAESLEGVKSGAQDFLKQDQSDDFAIVGNLLQCDDKYTKAVQSGLNDLMDTLVSAESDAQSFVTWGQNNLDKSSDFMLTRPNANNDTQDGNESQERLRLALGVTDDGSNELIPFADIITVPHKFGPLLSELLVGQYVVPQLCPEDFTKISESINFKTLISLDGSILIKNTGGGKILTITDEAHKLQGMVERNNRIVSIDSNVKILQTELEILEQKVKSEKVVLDESISKYEEVKNSLVEAKAEVTVFKSSFEAKANNLKMGQERLSNLTKRKADISSSRLALLEEEEKLGKHLSVVELKLQEEETRCDEMVDELELMRTALAQSKEELLKKQIEAKSFKDRQQSIQSQLADVEGQLQRLKVRLESNQQLITQYHTEIDAYEIQIQTLSEDCTGLAKNLQTQQEQLHSMKDKVEALIAAMYDRENEVKLLAKNISKAEKKQVEYEIRLGQYLTEEAHLVRNIFEKYQINLREVLATFCDISEQQLESFNDLSTMFTRQTDDGPKQLTSLPYEFTKIKLQELKQCQQYYQQYKIEYAALGEINWQAIEDYRRQKFRSDFLKEHEQDLTKSLLDLQQAITHIDEKSKKRFKLAYEEVSSRFEKVFPIIFGGGNAKLDIVGDLSDAECGIDIIARPPGKKMQNINLMSGGEKAMTAVSLIFSIFLVKPSPFCLLDEVDAPLDDANIGRFNELLREMSKDSQFILITHNKKTMEMNDSLYGVTMQEPGISKAVSVQLH
ncbi:MAG: chromosome segregation protein SMC [Bacteriovoracaceae bacterium]|nr:chromosome segregation protein SMC [Bacteriovoracaceae bacterium]